MKALLTAALGLALLASAGQTIAAPNCSIKLKSDDRMQFDLKGATVSSSCKSITVELVHTGKLPVAAMGHNIVISSTANMAAINAAGMKAGAAAGYLPKADARVIVATAMIGGGGSSKAMFPGSRLKAGGDYSFYCSFPGHAALMQGKVNVIK